MEIQLHEILSFSEKLEELIEERATQIAKLYQQDKYQSDETDKLALALSKAQGKMKPIVFNQENPYLGLGYADLSSILLNIRAPLEEFELSLEQKRVLRNDGAIELHTILRHSSGQWSASRARIVAKRDDIKAFESALNAEKRMEILALLNIAITNDPMDDDAEIAMADARMIIAKGPSTKYNPREQSKERITKEQLEEIEYIIGDYVDIGETLLENMGLLSLADLPKSQFHAVSMKAKEIVEFRNKGRKIK